MLYSPLPLFQIYCAPRMADRVLCIDPETNKAFLVGPSLKEKYGLGENKFNGGRSQKSSREKLFSNTLTRPCFAYVSQEL